MTGHLLGAAGAIEAIVCIKSIECNKIPATINTQVLDVELPGKLDIVLGKNVESHVNVAMSNTFGFGGHNAVVLFKKIT
jgi:3-oxoacyl-[acyl-carrier-protein] synthase II